MGQGKKKMKYLLVVKDDISSYCWLWPSVSAESSHVASELSRWIQTLPIMNMWVSDQGSHFKNSVIRDIAKQYGIKHNFSAAYSP